MNINTQQNMADTNFALCLHSKAKAAECVRRVSLYAAYENCKYRHKTKTNITLKF